MNTKQFFLGVTLLLAGMAATMPAHGASVDPERIVVAAKSSPAMQEGKEALDDGDYNRARRIFAEVARNDRTQEEMALFWKAYAEERSRRLPEALQTLRELERKYPNGRWADDARALRVEIEQRRGGGSEDLPDDIELKMYAIMGLANIDEDAAEQALKEILEGDGSEEIKVRALFLMTQIDESAAREVLPEWATRVQSVRLRRQAIQMLGMIGDDESLTALDEMYANANNNGDKHMIMQAFMQADAAERLLKIVRTEEDDALKARGIEMLGLLENTSSLRALLDESSSERVRRAVLQAAMMADDTELLLEVYQTSAEPGLRSQAIQMLDMMEYDEAGFFFDAYQKAGDESEAQAALHAMMLAEDGESLVRLFRVEQEPQRKKQILQLLSMTDDEAALALFEEILRD